MPYASFAHAGPGFVVMMQEAREKENAERGKRYPTVQCGCRPARRIRFSPARWLAKILEERMEQKRVALVTGGSGGIGRATVAALAAAGHRVLFTYREREADAKAVEAHVRAGGGHALAQRADVASRDSARAAVEAALN